MEYILSAQCTLISKFVLIQFVLLPPELRQEWRGVVEKARLKNQEDLMNLPVTIYVMIYILEGT